MSDLVVLERPARTLGADVGCNVRRAHSHGGMPLVFTADSPIGDGGVCPTTQTIKSFYVSADPEKRSSFGRNGIEIHIPSKLV
jgi:hypothetical protein